jgi:hypothetical protein
LEKPSSAAREFFLSRIAREAHEEGRPLSHSQRILLESGEDCSRQQEAVFDRENPEYLKFIEWVTELLRRAREKEISGDPAAGENYKAMAEDLNESESGSPLWFAVAPAVHPDALQRGFRLGWIVALVALSLGAALGIYAMRHGWW